jgi:cell wall-associated NlpC family hydrolase
MKRVYAVATGLALSLAPVLINPGFATADPRTTGQAKPIEIVIQRALSQRGVPFVYGGGGVLGPTNGIRPDVGTPPGPTAARPDTAALPGLTALPGTAPGTGGVPGIATAPGTGGVPGVRPVGFDASGLIQYAFAGAGIKMPRTSGEQCNVGRKIPPAQARRGDLICYGPGGSQSVALFLGNGQMVETDGTAVTVSSVHTTDMTPYLTRIIES